MTTTHHTYQIVEGTPLEIGSQIFQRICIPAIQQACHSLNATPEQLTQFYCGFLQACMGSMTVDYGPEQAAEIIQILLNALKGTDFNDPGTTTH